MPEDKDKKQLSDQELESKILNCKMSDIKAIIAEAVKDMSKQQIEDFRREILQVQRDAIFPSGDGTHVESVNKSIIDTSFFYKNYPHQPLAGAQVDGQLMGERLRSSGGPFVRLSPEMKLFAEVLRCRGRAERMAIKGLNVQEYNKQVIEAEKKDVDPLTTTDVGALVPTEYLATVVEFATAQSQIIPKVWRIAMGSLITKIPKLVQTAGSYFGGVVLYHPEEAALKTDTKPEFDSLTFTAKKLVGLIVLTDELIMDSSINIINYVTGLFTRAFQYQIENEIIQGTGANGQMLGILNDPGINVVARQTVGTIVYDDMINLESALDENFVNLTFLSRRATVNTLRKQRDSVGQPVYHDGFTTFLGGAMTPQLLGYPCIKTRNVPALGSQGDLILGDLGYYIWALRQDMTIDTSREYLFPYDETAVRFVMREDGAPGVSIAFAVLDNVPES